MSTVKYEFDSSKVRCKLFIDENQFRTNVSDPVLGTISVIGAHNHEFSECVKGKRVGFNYPGLFAIFMTLIKILLY